MIWAYIAWKNSSAIFKLRIIAEILWKYRNEMFRMFMKSFKKIDQHFYMMGHTHTHTSLKEWTVALRDVIYMKIRLLCHIQTACNQLRPYIDEAYD